MWRLVEQYTGKVGYQRGVKAEGLAADPPVIDCSGWSRVLLSAAMKAENDAADCTIFDAATMSAIQAWSDRIIEAIEMRTGRVLHGDEVTAESIPRCAAIGVKQGDPAWARNYPRSRGITHIVQVVRRPIDDAPMVSESLGWIEPYGIRLTPLDEWLVLARPHMQAGEIWAVDPFAMTTSSN